MIGENDDAGPINPVRFMFPKFPSKKSIAPSAINIYPTICISYLNLFEALSEENYKSITSDFMLGY